MIDLGRRWQSGALLAAALLTLVGCGSGGASATPAIASPAPQRPGPTATVVADAPVRGLARPAPGQSGAVTIYLPRLFEDGSLGLRAVARPAARPEDVARDVLRALIQGPTGDERAADFQYPLPPRARLRSVTVDGGTARVDFESGIERVHGRPFSELVYWSIVYTLTEVSGVDRVALFYSGEPLRELGYPPFPVPSVAGRADVPDWARPR